jgi:hypothetical protein
VGTWSCPQGRSAAPEGCNVDLFVKDFEANTITPLDATQLGDGLSSDHPAWSPDGSPDRPDSTVTTQANTPITIELECTDTGPAYERTDPSGFVAGDGAPQNGTTSDDAPTANSGRTATIVGTPGDDALLGSAVSDRRTSCRPGRRAIRDRP